ncbi:hypothetical protein DFH08DRAFT_988694 [Mycena albidolilacea]|uniref:F-box domain-containing protein n=1 Tax=Mycena albidolilacea TaxID=1033008 RepID=A0AAD6Z1J2_9AGAR|nr:hypothetical protein DFH08DRAFT_988694 [Mycena albidolilacea]
MSFSLQPLELLDTIASFFPLPSDLLSLALTSKALCSIIIPQHIEVCEVCCDPRREMFWRLLADRLTLSRRITSLELYPEPFASRQLLIPQSLDVNSSSDLPEDGSSNGYEWLMTAFAGMSSLRRFSCGLVSGDFGSVFQALDKHCPDQRGLAISCYHDFAVDHDIESVIRSLRAFPTFRGATLSISTTSAMHQLARKLPHLERLVLAGSRWNLFRWRANDEENRLPFDKCISILTSLVHLTHLDTSTLLASDADPAFDDLIRALSAAPKLQYIGVDFLHPEYTLPSLRSFSSVRDVCGEEGNTGFAQDAIP